MSGLRRILRNAAWLLAGRMAAQALMVLVTVVLAARLGPVGFGGYAFLAAVLFLANVTTTFGTDMALIREIAAGGRAARWPAALVVQLVLSLVAIALIWAIAPLVPDQTAGVADALRLWGLALLPAAVFSVASAGLRGAGRLPACAAVGAAGTALQLGAVWLLVPTGAALTRVALVLVAVQVALAALGWAACAARQPVFRRIPRVRTADVAEMARSSARIGLLGLLGVFYQRAGVLALAMVAGPAATGWFAAASRVTEASKSGHVSLFGALYPEMATAHAGAASDPASGTNAGLRSAWRVSVGGAAVVSAALLVLGSVVVGRLYGPAFGPSVGALAILALSIVPSTAATHRSLELVATGRERQMVRVLAVSLAVLLALLAVLLPAAGWLGVCWAILGAETFQAALLLAGRRRPSGIATRRRADAPAARNGEGGRELPEPTR